jgi:mRNA-degrading endonuclease toxin of MazEF toxin-antitoxin module
MSKDFDKWNTFKKKIHESEKAFIYKAGEVWWCALGLNIGHEQDGDQESFERPVVIIRTFSNDTCICIPMTTSYKENHFYYPLETSEKSVFIITSQIRTISTKRLLKKV